MLLTVATLTAATAAIFVLGQALSAYGIGNGFALLFLTTRGPGRPGRRGAGA